MTGWYRGRGKAAVVCTGQRTQSSHGTDGYLSITAFAGATNPDFLPLLQVGCIGGKKGQHELDQKEQPPWVT